MTLPLTRPDKVAALLLKGFVTPQEGPKMEHGIMDTKGYDLLLNVGYDPTKEKAIGQLSPEITCDKVHELNDIQRMIRQKGWSIKNPTTGLGYTSKPLLRILIKRSPLIKHVTNDVILRLGAISTPKKKTKR
ncbi:hypothetical protein LIER_42857 [Lithospermum erythrorhizon]|uniref:Uncharacterized protein n=1 Tax=Lithospermum erythrorhizon TaxID=34254 RepID=A0AAV3P1P6_LITER